MKVFFRGSGKWVTNIHSHDIDNQTDELCFYTSIVSEHDGVCGFFTLNNRNSEIEYKHNKTLETACYLDLCENHEDKALPPEIDWGKLGVNEPNLYTWGDCEEDFCISRYFIIDKTKKPILEVKDNFEPVKPDMTLSERHTMLKLIIGMAMDSYKYVPHGSRNTASENKGGSISAKLQNHKINISDDTIRTYLKEATEIL